MRSNEIYIWLLVVDGEELENKRKLSQDTVPTCEKTHDFLIASWKLSLLYKVH